MIRAFLILLLGVSALLPLRPAWGDDALYEKVYAQYPRAAYVVGIGETPGTGNELRDRRVAEVMARRELAAQIRVEVSEVAVDIMCSGSAGADAGKEDPCREEYSSLLETRVSEFIQSSRIVEHGVYNGRVYAVAVMEKKKAAGELMDEAKDSAERTRQYIEKAQSGDASSAEKAREEYKHAKALAAQSDAFEGVRGRADELFGELDREIQKLGGH